MIQVRFRPIVTRRGEQYAGFKALTSGGNPDDFADVQAARSAP